MTKYICTYTVTSVGTTELITQFESRIITEGSTTTILCEAIGYPPPTILWNRIDGILSDRVSVSDSVSVPTGYGNVTRVSVSLTINTVSTKDTGDYICSANNSVGSDSSNVSITVQCKLCESVVCMNVSLIETFQLLLK